MEKTIVSNSTTDLFPIAGSGWRNGIVLASGAMDRSGFDAQSRQPEMTLGNIARKWQKSTGDDRSNLTLKLMGRLIWSPKQRVPVAPQNGPRSNKNFNKYIDLITWHVWWIHQDRLLFVTFPFVQSMHYGSCSICAAVPAKDSNVSKWWAQQFKYKVMIILCEEIYAQK